MPQNTEVLDGEGLHELQNSLNNMRDQVARGAIDQLNRKKRRQLMLRILDDMLQMLATLDGVGGEVNDLAGSQQALVGKIDELCNRLEALGEPVTAADRDPTGDRGLNDSGGGLGFDDGDDEDAPTPVH